MAEGSARLAEAHRLAQHRIGVETAGALRVAFPLLDTSNIAGTEARWLRGVVPIVSAQNARSARLAGDYLRAARALDVGADPDFAPTLATIDPAQIATTMHVRGPVEARRLAGAPGARNRAFVSSTRSAARLVMQGGRDTITQTVANDPAAIGYARIGSGRCCYFCAMLISRGPVYSANSVHFRAHDNCSCGGQAVYADGEGWTDQARDFRAIWDESTEGLGGADAREAFRRSLAERNAAPPVAPPDDDDNVVG